MLRCPFLLGFLLHGVVPMIDLGIIEHLLNVVWRAGEIKRAERMTLLQLGYNFLAELRDDAFVSLVHDEEVPRSAEDVVVFLESLLEVHSL